MTTPSERASILPTDLPAGDVTAVGFPAAVDGVSLNDLHSRIAPAQKMPERIGGYRIVGVLGEGGMGIVYQALQLSLERTVALKVVRADLTRKEAFVGRFLREAKVAARIDHPNVVTIYDTGEADGHLYMALQYVPGGDLATRIKSGVEGKVDEDEALRIIAGCAKGLIAIHAAGLVHRDIKPSNIFLTTEGTPKIGDLGLARNIIDDEKLTFAGDLVGTPSYMAPEQAKGTPDIDHRADIYSLGTSFYHLLTGRPPFQGSSPFLIGHQVIAEVPQDPRELNRSMSPAVAAIIHHAMHKDRNFRYQSAEELLVDVELVRSGKLPRFARVTVMDEERRATRFGSLATAPAPLTHERRSVVPVVMGASFLVGIAAVLVVSLGLAQGQAETPLPRLPSAAFPSASSGSTASFPPRQELPPMIHEETPAAEFLAANQPTEQRTSVRPKPYVPPQPQVVLPPPPAQVVAAVAQPLPPVFAAAPSEKEFVAQELVVLPRPIIEVEPAIPDKVDDHQALRVVHEEVVRVPLNGAHGANAQARVPAPTTTLPAKINLVSLEQPAQPAVAQPAVAQPVTESPALIEKPMYQALATTTETRSLPVVNTAPAWAAALGSDRYGSWADLAVGTVTQRLRLCPGGAAQIGSPINEAGRGNDETVHRVLIDQAYWLADSECTQALWRTMMGDNPSSTLGDQLPVDSVSFQRVQDFLRRAADKYPGATLRLPSEVEWEAACRAGSRGPYSGGLDLRSLAWYHVNSGSVLAPVAGRRPNAYGLFDVHGNVWEWCQAADRTYPPDTDGLPIPSQAFIYRGGGFADTAEDCRAARRGGNQTGDGFPGVGFRFAISADVR
jgi:serine/threonine-protein kinase